MCLAWDRMEVDQVVLFTATDLTLAITILLKYQMKWVEMLSNYLALKTKLFCKVSNLNFLRELYRLDPRDIFYQKIAFFFLDIASLYIVKYYLKSCFCFYLVYKKSNHLKLPYLNEYLFSCEVKHYKNNVIGATELMIKRDFEFLCIFLYPCFKKV